MVIRSKYLPDPRVHWIVAAALLAVSVVSQQQAVGQEQLVSREYAIKAGVLAVLGKCVIWPPDVAASNGEPLRIGVLGDDPFVENGVNQLDRVVADEQRKGRHIVVQRFASLQDYEHCHILFVSSRSSDGTSQMTDLERVDAAHKAIGGATVLIVGESAGLAQRGAVANLVFDPTSNLIRLEINPDAAARLGLRLAPDLLRLKVVQIVRDPKS